jgi:hypothetical protein
MEEAGLREAVLSALRADQRNKLQQHMYLPRTEGDTDEG